VPNEKILIVEDEGLEALDMQRRLKSLGYATADMVFSGEEAVTKAAEIRPDLVLMDIMLNGEIDGIAAAEQIRASLDIPIIYVTAYADDDTLKRAKITHPYAYILKPFRDREIHVAIDMALYRHTMERKLKASEKWLATTLMSIGDAVIATDEQGQILLMNAVAEQLTGRNLHDVLHRKLQEVLHIINRDTRRAIDNPVGQVLLEGAMISLADHPRLIAPDAREIPLDATAAPIKDDQGKTLGVILVLRDISEREKAEEELQRAYAELEDRVVARTADLALTNRHLEQEIGLRKRAEGWLQEKNIELENARLAKERFLSSMSQQLRPALNATVGCIDTLLKLPGPLSESQEKHLQGVSSGTHYLPSLINDLLDLAQIESGTMEVKTEAVEVGGVIRDVMVTLKPQAEHKGLKFIDHLPEQDITIYTNRRALSQILSNLVRSVINFTEMGRVHLEFAQHQRGKELMTEISVVGTGSNMGEEYQKQLRDALKHLDDTSLRVLEGSGLGLHLSQRLAQLIGGIITLKSIYGKGTIFTLTLK
jgi:PAS domain S-box-containing protein